ncbi:uncharacterized protein LOC114531094 [Dendronephthya gigantea]|uniref:uncharacterized protein LOC114531094 n=1 Tax=Dendronephthya gigantea TaxID=151771 RepID=UPI001068E3DD|nr:uncharacterized protein LOC114531094 [Dendronephthya gigantea]
MPYLSPINLFIMIRSLKQISYAFILILLLDIDGNLFSVVALADTGWCWGKEKHVTKVKNASSLPERQVNMSVSKISPSALNIGSYPPAIRSSNNDEKFTITAPEMTGNLLSNGDLKALRNALLIHPFKTWNLKHKYSSMKDIRIHEDKLQAVIKNGDNARLRRKLLKVLRGEDVYLDAIGGSHTAGGGLDTEEATGIERVYYKVIADWWGKIITPITGSEIRTRGIGIGGTPSNFFQYCFRSYVHKKPDLVLLDTAVNDMWRKNFIGNKCIPLEQLTRQLLSYPTEPALVYVNFFPVENCNSTCTNIENFGQNVLTYLYNITTLSWKNAVCMRQGSLFNTCRDLVSKDKMHINQLGHAHISLMIINLIRKILQEGLAAKNNFLSDLDVKSISHEISKLNIQLPPPAFIRSGHLNIGPLCWTTLTPNYKKNVTDNNLDVVITKNNGFSYAMKKRRNKCRKSCRLDLYTMWTGETLGAYSELSFTVPANVSHRGINGRSVVISLRSCWICGTANIWVDNNFNKKRQFDLKDLRFERTLVEIIALRVKPGRHTLNIKVVKKGKVSLVGVMLGPPDGPF